MKTCVVLAALCFVGFVQQAHTTTCNHRSECSESECCSKGDSTTLNKYGLFQGTCKPFKPEGTKCEMFDISTCACASGLSCLLKDGSDESFDFDAERICRKSTEPAVPHPCDKDSDCAVEGECCVESRRTGWEGIFSIFHKQQKGFCHRFIPESSTCVVNDVYGCGCAEGLKCLYPETPEDGATPQRICMKEPKQ